MRADVNEAKYAADLAQLILERKANADPTTTGDLGEVKKPEAGAGQKKYLAKFLKANPSIFTVDQSHQVTVAFAPDGANGAQ